MEETIIYVSKNGNDSGDGSKARPFASPEAAAEEVKKLCAEGLTAPITVLIHAGNYDVKNISFTRETSGTAECPVTFKAAGDGRVIFNGGTLLENSCFEKVTDDKILSRLKENVRDKVVAADLKKLGITYEQIGRIYGIGSSNTEKYYGDGSTGINCEFFWNNKRLSVARYPDKGFLRFRGIVDEGDVKKHISGILELEKEVMERIGTWKEPEKAWMFAYFKYSWSEQVTPIEKYDFENNTVKPRWFSTYGYGMIKSKYYFYNVIEELDAPGEYYIDRENMILYVYPPEGEENLDAVLSLSMQVMISGEAEYLTFEGIEFTGVRNDVIKLNCDHVTFRNCTISNSYGSGILITGAENTVTGCEICAMGKGGVTITGGDRATLTPGNNVIENCYIHNFEEVYRTYQYGAMIYGCGNKIIHCELADAPHLAIGCYGNDQLIAYNYVHDVVYESEDAGAFYVGGDWSSIGCVIKYNYFRNIGCKKGDCKAIYFDDGYSHGDVIGNIVENCSGWAFNFGGGFNTKIKNNLTVTNYIPIHYDQRMGRGGWASIVEKTKPGEGMWTTLARVPYDSEIWKEKHPYLSMLKHDYADKDDPYFPANPANSEIMENVFIGPYSAQEYWMITSDVYFYSEIDNNRSFTDRRDALIDGTYDLKPEIAENFRGWERIPFEKIGRYGHELSAAPQGNEADTELPEDCQ